MISSPTPSDVFLIESCGVPFASKELSTHHRNTHGHMREMRDGKRGGGRKEETPSKRHKRRRGQDIGQQQNSRRKTSKRHTRLSVIKIYIRQKVKPGEPHVVFSSFISAPQHLHRPADPCLCSCPHLLFLLTLSPPATPHRMWREGWSIFLADTFIFRILLKKDTGDVVMIRGGVGELLINLMLGIVSRLNAIWARAIALTATYKHSICWEAGSVWETRWRCHWKGAREGGNIPKVH